jgi:hypothetical protein
MIVGARLLVVPLTALALAPLANAAPPTLLGVNHVQRHPQATWTLAPESEAAVVEVATSPQTGSDGYFFTENVEAFDTLEASQTTWLSSSRLKPGNYYVHVASYTHSAARALVEKAEGESIKAAAMSAPNASRRALRCTVTLWVRPFMTSSFDEGPTPWWCGLRARSTKSLAPMPRGRRSR